MAATGSQRTALRLHHRDVAITGCIDSSLRAGTSTSPSQTALLAILQLIGFGGSGSSPCGKYRPQVPSIAAEGTLPGFVRYHTTDESTS
jgi:hypothetical protein